MATSIPGKPPVSLRREGGFTLIELSVVLFVLGLMLWIVAPRLSAFGAPSRDARFRALASDSEAAFDTSLFEKREVRLAVDPRAPNWRFAAAGADNGDVPARDFGNGVAVTGIEVEGQERPLDVVTEIIYQPGGRLPGVRLFLRDTGSEGNPTEWTLRINPFDGSVDVLEGRIESDAA